MKFHKEKFTHHMMQALKDRLDALLRLKVLKDDRDKHTLRDKSFYHLK